jgi:hypothetical protein
MQLLYRLLLLVCHPAMSRQPAVESQALAFTGRPAVTSSFGLHFPAMQKRLPDGDK